MCSFICDKTLFVTVQLYVSIRKCATVAMCLIKESSIYICVQFGNKHINIPKMRQVLSPVIQVLVRAGPTQPKGEHEHVVSGPPVEWGKMTGAPLA